MATDKTLRKLVDARTAYRESVVAGVFNPFVDHVTPGLLSMQSLRTALDRLKDGQDKRRGIIQQAADFIGATQRAVDMRQMTHLDYISRYYGAVRFQDQREADRVARFEADTL